MDVQVKFEKETVWLSLNQISDLFGRDKSTISRHLTNIFNEGELEKKSVVAKNATTASDGKTYLVEFFNLDAIISVGYRVNSKKGTQFRVWATHQLRDHLIKGYTLNEKRLKQLQQTIQLVKRTSKQISNTEEAQDLMKILSERRVHNSEFGRPDRSLTRRIVRKAQGYDKSYFKRIDSVSLSLNFVS